MKSARILFFPALSCVILFFGSFHPRETGGTMTVSVKNYVGNQLLELDSLHYKNELGQDFTVGNFKFYLGNFRLRNENGKEFLVPDYFLVNAAEPSSLNFDLEKIPPGKYTSMEFLIGVDSLHNCSGAQSGALDPVNAMFWSWNTGYIFLKLEGKAAASKSPGHIFEYHIGGYRTPNNCIRTVKLNFPVAIEISAEKNAAINLKADAAEVLKTPVAINFETLSSVTDFHNATSIADNYSDMFSLLPDEAAK